MGINQNDIARQVSKIEGGKQELSIAQIKEVMKIYNTVLAQEEPFEVLKMLKRYK